MSVAKGIPKNNPVIKAPAQVAQTHSLLTIQVSYISASPSQVVAHLPSYSANRLNQLRDVADRTSPSTDSCIDRKLALDTKAVERAGVRRV